MDRHFPKIVIAVKPPKNISFQKTEKFSRIPEVSGNLPENVHPFANLVLGGCLRVAKVFWVVVCSGVLLCGCVFWGVAMWLPEGC